jgi:hypothetical protein
MGFGVPYGSWTDLEAAGITPPQLGDTIADIGGAKFIAQREAPILTPRTHLFI